MSRGTNYGDHAVIVSGTGRPLLHLEDRPLAQRLSQIDGGGTPRADGRACLAGRMGLLDDIQTPPPPASIGWLTRPACPGFTCTRFGTATSPRAAVPVWTPRP